MLECIEMSVAMLVPVQRQVGFGGQAELYNVLKRIESFIT